MPRRLAAIMFTDIAGYTAMTQADEKGALRLLHDQERLLRPLLEKHRGRRVKSMGDGLLLEFPNALDAIECGVEFQRLAHEHNAAPDARPINVRIGIHLGDVQREGTDILGDSVNIASRIEPLAEPGGVCLSAQVFDQVHNKVACPLEKLGSKTLKGVREPIDVYRVVLPWGEPEGIPGALEARSVPRLAVLPFANMSPDPHDEYFADGLTEEITSELSKVPGLQVIARTSVLRYKSVPKTIGEVGKELRVGSALEGSVRKAGTKIRVTAQLIDVSTEAHVWSASFDRELDDVFRVQSEIARGVSEALELRLLPADGKGHRTPSRSRADAFALYLKGRVAFEHPGGENELRTALECLRQAVVKDPELVPAWVCLSNTYHALGDRGFYPMGEAMSKAKEVIGEALRLSPRSAEAHVTLADIAHHECNWEMSEREERQALDLNPNLVGAHLQYGLLLYVTGRTREAMEHAREALDLDPLSGAPHSLMGELLGYSGRWGDAAAHLRNAIEIDGTNPFWHSALGTALVMQGSVIEGIKEIERANASAEWKDPILSVQLAWAYSKAGRSDDVARIRSKMVEDAGQGRGSPGAMAAVFAVSGDTDAALDWLEKCRKDPGGFPPTLVFWPFFEGLRSNPRFVSLCRGMGLKEPSALRELE
jgi:adenylate cyclase